MLMIITCKTTGRRFGDKRVNIAWHAAVRVGKHNAITVDCLRLDEEEGF